MKIFKAHVHTIFECSDCHKKFQGILDKKKAKEHAKKYKHFVLGEEAVGWQYDGRN